MQLSHFVQFSLIYCLVISLAACGGSGGNTPTENVDSLSAAQPTLVYGSIKSFEFTWTDSEGADFYRLLENHDSTSGFVQVGEDIAQGDQSSKIYVPLYKRLDASYILQTCNVEECVDSNAISVSGDLKESVGYIKSNNPDEQDNFGHSISLSGDGNTLAIGAHYEDSSAAGINPADTDSDYQDSGAVYIFSRDGFSWNFQTLIKASNSEEGDWFGYSLSLDSGGNTLVVGASREDSSSRGVNGIQTDNNAQSSGAAYIFVRNNETWSQQAYLKASNADASDNFGQAVSISGDGQTIAVGADGEASRAEGIDGDQTSNNWNNAGAVYMFAKTGSSWQQQAYIKASNTLPSSGQRFGKSVDLSNDGNSLAVGARSDDSNATGVNGDESDTSAIFSGAAFIFSRLGATWSQQAYIKASNTDAQDVFGIHISLSGDGSTLAVAAALEDSSSLGINNDQVDNSAVQAGAVYVFTLSGNTWSQEAYIKASNTDAFDEFGSSVSLSDNGDTLAIGALAEDSFAFGIGGDEQSNIAEKSGAAYLFERNGVAWSQLVYVKSSSPGVSDWFGSSVSLSADGNTLAVGAQNEDGSGTSLGNNNTFNSGAVYLY